LGFLGGHGKEDENGVLHPWCSTAIVLVGRCGGYGSKDFALSVILFEVLRGVLISRPVE
jgi:hypothetical protein